MSYVNFNRISARAHDKIRKRMKYMPKYSDMSISSFPDGGFSLDEKIAYAPVHGNCVTSILDSKEYTPTSTFLHYYQLSTTNEKGVDKTKYYMFGDSHLKGHVNEIIELSATDKNMYEQVDFEYGGKNHMNREEISIIRKQLEVLKNSEIKGIKKILMNIEDTFIDSQLKKLKNKFGVEMCVTRSTEINAVTSWIKQKDPNFKHHIQNPYSSGNVKNEAPILAGTFILKLCNRTYVYVNTDIMKIGKYTTFEDTPRSIYLYIFGKKAYSVFKELSKCIEDSNTSSNKIYSIVGEIVNDRTCWNCTASKLTPRTMDTIFIDKGQKKRIIDHINQWMSSEEMYVNRGLLFKTGILLHGHAGTGKSSMAMAIANHLGCGLITIDPMTFQHMNIAEITESIVADDTTYVVLIDEIDTIFVSRDAEDATENQKKTTNKLLSFLDSPQSPTNVVFVATTNYINRLDKALMRKGRFDVIEEMGDIARCDAMDMCMSFGLSDSDARYVLDNFGDVTEYNPAQLQDAILNLIKQRNEKINGSVDVTDADIENPEDMDNVTVTSLVDYNKELPPLEPLDDAIIEHILDRPTDVELSVLNSCIEDLLIEEIRNADMQSKANKEDVIEVQNHNNVIPGHGRHFLVDSATGEVIHIEDDKVPAKRVETPDNDSIVIQSDKSPENN